MPLPLSLAKFVEAVEIVAVTGDMGLVLLLS